MKIVAFIAMVGILSIVAQVSGICFVLILIIRNYHSKPQLQVQREALNCFLSPCLGTLSRLAGFVTSRKLTNTVLLKFFLLDRILRSGFRENLVKLSVLVRIFVITPAESVLLFAFVTTKFNGSLPLDFIK